MYTYAKICHAHVKDPVVHVSVRWTTETLKTKIKTNKQQLQQNRKKTQHTLEVGFSRESDPDFQWEEPQWEINLLKKQTHTHTKKGGVTKGWAQDRDFASSNPCFHLSLVLNAGCSV